MSEDNSKFVEDVMKALGKAKVHRRTVENIARFYLAQQALIIPRGVGCQKSALASKYPQVKAVFDQYITTRHTQRGMSLDGHVGDSIIEDSIEKKVYRFRLALCVKEILGKVPSDLYAILLAGTVANPGGEVNQNSEVGIGLHQDIYDLRQLVLVDAYKGVCDTNRSLAKYGVKVLHASVIDAVRYMADSYRFPGFLNLDFVRSPRRNAEELLQILEILNKQMPSGKQCLIAVNSFIGRGLGSKGNSYRDMCRNKAFKQILRGQWECLSKYTTNYRNHYSPMENIILKRIA